MGVVRREGAWRLEKLDKGHYELTHQHETTAKILTPDYSPGLMDDVTMAPVPVHEVDSYAEAEGIFEEHAHGSKSGDILSAGGGVGGGTSGLGGNIDVGSTGSSSGASRSSGDQELIEEAGNLPPGGIAVVLVLAGGITIGTYGFAPGDLVSLFAMGMVVFGLLIFGWAGLVFRDEGLQEAVDFLASMDDAGSSGGKSSNEEHVETTTAKPVPEKRKRELIFGRAEQECEWCDDHLDNPEVHHIEPRSEGGSNDPSNLIVLCPTCHRKADRGGITKTKLKQKMRHTGS